MNFGLSPQSFSAGQWWQLWTCHLAHWSFSHLAMNLVAAAPAVVLAPRWLRRYFVPWAICIAPVLSWALILANVQGEYRGASGLVVAMWALSGVVLVRMRDWRGAALLSLLAIKVAAEALHVLPWSVDNFQTLSLIHYAGTAIGLLSGCVIPLVQNRNASAVASTVERARDTERGVCYTAASNSNP